MRVLSVIETLLHGGAETVLVDLVRGLRLHDHRVLHFSTAHGTSVHPWIADALVQASVPCQDVHWTALQDPGTRPRLLCDFEPDVVIYHWWGQDTLQSWRAAAASRSRARRPWFVVVLHRSGVPAPAGFDAYVLVTPSQRPQVAHVDRDRVHVIPNGVEVSRFDPPDPRSARRPFTVGRISSLRSGKIPADWVRVAAGYGLRGARFVIAGDGPLRSQLEADVRALGLDAQFLLPGYVNRREVPQMLSTFDVFCYVTSTAVECHPLALLEASAAGLPIVAEARGGVPDIVADGISGLLARTSDEVGACLRRLRRDRALRRRLAAGARDVAARYSRDRQLASYAALLNQAAGARAG
jgi:glycosyltransferase involved in cell wall biosynthesis